MIVIVEEFYLERKMRITDFNALKERKKEKKEREEEKIIISTVHIA